MVSSAELSKEIDVSQRYLMQIIAKLRDAGIIGVSKGMSGGYILLEDTARINIYDIVILMEGISVPVSESIKGEDELTLNGALSLLKDYIETYLQSITLDMLIGNNPASEQVILVRKVEDHIASLKNGS